MPSDPSTSFSASYDSTTRITSAVIFVVLLGILALTQSVVLGCLFALLLVGAYAWSPRGYSIAQRSVIVKRLIGETSASRSTASARSESLLRMIFATASETFGNGGLFGYYGQFSTSKLGSSTWYVTNRSNSVVVITSSKTAVFSPDDMDGFLAAIQAAAPVPATAPGGARLDSKQSNGAARLTGALVGGAIAIVVLAIVAFAMLYSPGPPSYTLTAESLTIHDRFYPVTLPPSGVDIEHIRLIDVGADADWRPTARTNGFANAHYRSGWFRVASGKKIRMYQADSTHLVLLPPKGDGAAVLLETTDPEKFMREVRQRWSNRS